jgi:hypothetical protein
LKGEARKVCLEDPERTFSAPEAGYCYIDPTKGPRAGGMGPGCTEGNDANWAEECGNPNVDSCSATTKRLLRLVGNEANPATLPGSTTFIACVGSALSQ